jgi:hypothetical protein
MRTTKKPRRGMFGKHGKTRAAWANAIAFAQLVVNLVELYFKLRGTT